jgi:hypothetical protein
MSDFERLLVPGCTELPACRCGTEMHIARTNSLAGKVIRISAFTIVLRATIRCGLLFGVLTQ